MSWMRDGWERIKDKFQKHPDVKPVTGAEPRMIPWRTIYGPWPKGGVLHPEGARNRHSRRAANKVYLTREQRMAYRRIRKMRKLRGWRETA